MAWILTRGQIIAPVVKSVSIVMSIHIISCIYSLEAKILRHLRVPHRNDGKIAKFGNLGTFWLVIQLINHTTHDRKMINIVILIVRVIFNEEQD